MRDRLGGWMQQSDCLRGRKIIPYHLNWIYFLDRFGIEASGYVERRPGISPSAAHVADLVELIRREQIQALWVSNYFARRVPELIVERTGVKLLYVPLYPDPSGPAESTDVFGLYDLWINQLRSVFPECSGA